MNPPNENRLPIKPQEWLLHAKSDLTLAKLGIGNSNILNSQICFHAQQAVEKALKAILLFLDEDFPLTHDLELLLHLINNTKIELPKDLLLVGDLTPYAVETRYPDYYGGITDDEVKKSIELAEKTINWSVEIIESQK